MKSNDKAKPNHEIYICNHANQKSQNVRSCLIKKAARNKSQTKNILQEQLCILLTTETPVTALKTFYLRTDRSVGIDLAVDNIQIEILLDNQKQ